MIIITILGWILAVAIIGLVAYWIFCTIAYYVECKIQEIEWRGVKKFAQRNRSHCHYLNGKEREPYREFYEFIFNRIERGVMSGDDTRQKVDQLIEKSK